MVAAYLSLVQLQILCDFRPPRPIHVLGGVELLLELGELMRAEVRPIRAILVHHLTLRR